MRVFLLANAVLSAGLLLICANVWLGVLYCGVMCSSASVRALMSGYGATLKEWSNE